MNRRQCFQKLFALALLPFVVSGCAVNGTITPTSQLGVALDAPITSLLFVAKGSGPAPSPLLMQQAAINRELSSQLTAELATTGIRFSAVSLSPVEMDPQVVISQAVRTAKPSHLLEFSVPSASSRSDTAFILKHTVRADITSLAARKVVWRYTANVDTGKGAEPQDVAAALIARMRQDGVIR